MIQRLLEYGDQDTIIQSVLTEVKPYFDELCKDQFGNYVIQHILDYGKNEQVWVVIDKLQWKAIEMSTHKFSSNVVEKCIIRGTDKQ